MAGPPIEITKPEKFVGAPTPLEVAVQAPGAQCSTTADRARAERQAVSAVHARRSERRAGPQDDGDRIVVIAARSASRRCRSSSRARHRWSSPRRKVLYGIRTVESTARRDLQVRLERPRVSVVLDPSLRQPRRLRGGRLPGDAGGRARRAWWSATSSIPAIRPPAPRSTAVKIADPALRVAFFALLHDQDLKTPIRALRARRGGQHGARRFRLPRLPEAVQAQPHRARRQASRPRRAGHPRRHDRGQAGRGHPREVPGHQRRAAPEEQRRRSRRSRRRPGPSCCGGGVVFHPFAQHRRGVGLRRSPHLHLQGQGGRSAGAPRLRSRLVRRHADRRRPTAASCSSPRSSASTATASSSITAWACSRSTGTSRRSTSRPARPSRRNSRSAAAA